MAFYVKNKKDKKNKNKSKAYKISCYPKGTSSHVHQSKTHMSRDMRFQQCSMCDQQSLRSACAYTQSDQSLF